MMQLGLTETEQNWYCIFFSRIFEIISLKYISKRKNIGKFYYRLNNTSLCLERNEHKKKRADL